ncbi:MAG: hypothetical protein ACPLKP_02800 [Microgenomates group bacterium]
MKLETAKIVGVATPIFWSQVHIFFPTEEEKISRRGQLIAVISIEKTQQEGEIASIGKEIIARLHEEYYGWLENSPFAQLKQAVERVFQEANGNFKVEIIAGSLVKNVLCLAFRGEGEAYLLREGKLGKILKGNSLTIETASGFVEKGDILLLGSKKFFEIIPRNTIELALKENSPFQACEILSPLVLGEKEGLASAVVGKVIQDEEEKLEKPEESFLISKKRINFPLIFGKIKQKIIAVPKKEKSSQSLITVALILSLLLAVGVIYGGKERKKKEREKQIKEILSQVAVKKQEGESLLVLNPSKARETLKEAEKLLEELGEIPPELAKTKEELRFSLEGILKEYQQEPELFFDLELIKKEGKGKEFLFTQGKILVLDQENGAIYQVDKEKRSTILVSSEEIKKGKKLAVFKEQVFLLTSEGIYRLEKESLEKLVEVDSEIKDFAIFAGNIYTLDSSSVWIYSSVGEGFSPKRKWLNEERDFSLATQMIINGSIWIVNGGKIEKYFRGKQDIFRPEGLDKNFSSELLLAVGEKDNFLYILDKGHSRLVVLNKNGQYYAQYLFKGGNFSDLTLDEEGKMIFLLQESKIFQLKLKD